MSTITADASRVGSARPRIPGPDSPPLIGWRARVIGLLRDPILGMLRLQSRYGDIVALGHEADSPILVFAPEHNHLLLTNPDLFYNLDTSSPDSLIHMPQGTAAARLLSGVAGMNGAKHRRHRRLLIPAFHKKRVEALHETLVACTQTYLRRWHVGGRYDLAREMNQLSLAMAVSGLLGLDPEQEGRAVGHTLEQWSVRALSVPVGLLPFDIPGFPYHRFLQLSDELEAVFRSVIRRKLDAIGAGVPGAEGKDALAILLEARADGGDSLTDSDLLGHLTTLFTAGHETTASALTWTLFLLAQHPRILGDLLDELDGVLHGVAPTLDQLRDLPLLGRVIDESMRLFPPGMWMLRTTTAPVAIGPYELPARTHIVYSPAVTHRRPDLYPDPSRFRPERWETIDPSPYEYLPFGAGPRRCLGATFAAMELKVVLPIVLQQFRIVLADGLKVDRGGTALSGPRGGLPVTLAAPPTIPPAARLRGNIHALLTHD